MTKEEIEKVADCADFIVAGFAFTQCEEGTVRVLNLNHTDDACVLDSNGEMLETTMSDETLALVQAYYLKNKEFLELQSA